MKWRHEWKHEINYSDRLALLARLSAVMKRDSHAIDGVYKVRSLYFDSLGDKALREKIDGVNAREKFRIRFYNGDTSYIVLEKRRNATTCVPRKAAGFPRRKHSASPTEIFIFSCRQTSRCVWSCIPK